MNRYAKDHWVPVDISLPDSNRLVQIQIAELPDPTIGSYWSDNGEWILGEKGYDALETITVLAWREMAEAYKEEDEVLIFRSADEARILTFNALQRAKNGNLEKEFYEIRTKILSAADSEGMFSTQIKEISADNVIRLTDAGYEVTANENGYYIISWK
jgi:hypothetical protein